MDMIIHPVLDSLSGKSYSQSAMTPGTLGGRRGVETWYFNGEITGPPSSRTHEKWVHVRGADWVIVGNSGRVRSAPSGGDITVNILASRPSLDRTYRYPFESLFEYNTPLSRMKILDGEKEATPGKIRTSGINPVQYFVIPEGSIILVNSSSSGSPGGYGLLVELHYRVRQVGQ